SITNLEGEARKATTVVERTAMPRRRVGIGFLVLVAAIAVTLITGPPASAALTFRITDLGTLGGARSSALAVNDSGQVVGWATRPDGKTHAFSWTRTGGMVDLGTLGGSSSTAVDVNASGVV